MKIYNNNNSKNKNNSNSNAGEFNIFGKDVYYKLTREMANNVFLEGKHRLKSQLLSRNHFFNMRLFFEQQKIEPIKFEDPKVERLAELIAEHCNEVDNWKNMSNASWSFNTNESNDDEYNWCVWGTFSDARWNNIAESLNSYFELRTRLTDQIERTCQNNRIITNTLPLPMSFLVNNMIVDEFENRSDISCVMMRFAYGLHALQNMFSYLPPLVCRNFNYHFGVVEFSTNASFQISNDDCISAIKHYIKKVTKLYLTVHSENDLDDLIKLIDEARDKLRKFFIVPSSNSCRIA